MDGCPLGLGLVVEDKPTEFSCMLRRVLILLHSKLEVFQFSLHASVLGHWHNVLNS